MAPAAIQAADAPSTVGWVSNPNERGTASLVISCLLTLGLCVWSALHLNIPPKDESRQQYWLRRIKWSICGVLIPEIVVLLAWRQWTSAGRLTSEINKAINDLEYSHASPKLTMSQTTSTSQLQGQDQSGIKSRPHLPPRIHPWTNVHSFYAGAGGFVFQLKGSENGYGAEPFIYGPQRLTLTAHGVLLLAQCGLLPDIDEREIKDKSKTDGLAKVLVLLQASWMLLQTLGRTAAHIPTSLLEINTIGHILCAFVVYLLWWKKPREIHEPTILQGEIMDSICAYMYMSSRVSGTRVKGFFKPRSWITPELKRCMYLDHNKTKESPGSLCLSKDGPVDTIQPHTKAYLRKEPTICITPTDIQPSGSFKLQPFRHLDSQRTIARKIKMGWTQEPSFDTPALRQTRHRLAASAVHIFPVLRARFNKVEQDANSTSVSQITTYEPIIEQLVVRHARNWPSDFLLPGLAGELMGITLWFATMAYGGVHIAAWNEYFPTNAEKQLWHLSSVYIACSGLLWLLMNIAGATSSWAKSYWNRFVAFEAFWLEYIVYGITATACGILYIFTRAFLVVDAIASLRQLPVQIYSTPQWSEFIPHL